MKRRMKAWVLLSRYGVAQRLRQTKPALTSDERANCWHWVRGVFEYDDGKRPPRKKGAKP